MFTLRLVTVSAIGILPSCEQHLLPAGSQPVPAVGTTVTGGSLCLLMSFGRTVAGRVVGWVVGGAQVAGLVLVGYAAREAVALLGESVTAEAPTP